MFLLRLDWSWWQGLVEGLRPFSPGTEGVLARSPAEGLGQVHLGVSASSSFRGRGGGQH